MPGTPRPETVSTKQRRIAKLARNAPELSFTTLAHHIDIVWLRKAYALTRKDGAVGVDGQTAEEYEVNLRDNLQGFVGSSLFLSYCGKNEKKREKEHGKRRYAAYPHPQVCGAARP